MKKRNMTLQESINELGKAWREFVSESAKILGIRKLLDWLAEKRRI